MSGESMLVRMERQRQKLRHQATLRKIKSRKPGYMKAPGSLMPADFDNCPPAGIARVIGKSKDLKKEMDAYNRRKQIERQNNTLLKRLFMQDSRPTLYGVDSRPKPKSLNVTGRRTELLRIVQANEKLERRINTTQSQYTVKQWEMDFKKNKVFRKHFSRFHPYDEDVLSQLRRSPIRRPRPPSRQFPSKNKNNNTPRKQKLIDDLASSTRRPPVEAPVTTTPETELVIKRTTGEKMWKVTPSSVIKATNDSSLSQSSVESKNLTKDLSLSQPKGYITIVSDTQYRQAFSALFQNYHDYEQEEENGLSVHSLQKLMIDFSKFDVTTTADEKNITVASSQELSVFMAAMDSDGNGKISEDELINFFLKGCKLSKLKTSQFIQRSAMHAKILRIIMLTKKMVEKRVHAVQRLFEMYQQNESCDDGIDDPDATVNAAGLHRMITGTINTDVSDDHVKLFVQALDADGNGSVQRKEVVEYFLKAMAQNPAARKKFAARSSFHGQLSQFLSAVLDMSDSKLYAYDDN